MQTQIPSKGDLGTTINLASLDTTKRRNSKPPTRGAGSTSVVGLLASAVYDNPTLVPKDVDLEQQRAQRPSRQITLSRCFWNQTNRSSFRGGEMCGAGMKT